MEKKFLTMLQAVEYTGMSAASLYKATGKKELPYFKPGGMKIVFLREDLENWVMRNRIAPADELSEQAQAYCLK